LEVAGDARGITERIEAIEKVRHLCETGFGLFLAADVADQREETVGGASAILRPGRDVERHHLRAGHQIGVDRRYARTARAPGNDGAPPFQIDDS